MSNRGWNSVSYLDAIRPDPGWRVDYALLSSYLADLVALVAAILALAGLDDDRGSGSKVDFANAVEQLKDRVRLIVQAGRLVVPHRTPKIMGILDRYIREVAADEAKGSWHPKLALVRLETEDGPSVQWRLWIGSRNLTRDLSWDVGMTLSGVPGESGGQVAGIADLGELMAEHASLPSVRPSRVAAELRRVVWSLPEGCGVKSIRLLDGKTPRSLPPAPTGLRKLIVISPFLDGTTIGTLGHWGDEGARRILVATRSELAKLARQTGRPLDGFADLLCIDAPDRDSIQSEEETQVSATGTQDEELEGRGLHAKIIYASCGNIGKLWTGSANATQRGWCGPNAEVIADIDVNDSVGAGLEAFVTDCATIVRLDELPAVDETDEIEERLEQARKEIAAQWQVAQRVEADSPRLVSARCVHPADGEVVLEVGLLGSERAIWPRGQQSLQLPPVAASDVTELVVCRVLLQDRHAEWLQRAPLDPPPGDERDHRALARYLDPRTFLLWIRSLLTTDDAGEGGGDWDQSGRRSPQPTPQGASPTWWAPTLEEILKAWSRDPASVQLVDRKLRHYLKLYEEQQSDSYASAEDRRVVQEFHRTWQILRRELVQGAP